jgi:hypothetical protein
MNVAILEIIQDPIALRKNHRELWVKDALKDTVLNKFLSSIIS